jgi:uncharacterized membrane protein YeaQ/YmgE (transglycosylase-associated protein family)
LGFTKETTMLKCIGLTALATAVAVLTLGCAGGYGFIFDMVFGLVGSVVGGAIVWVFISSDTGMLAMLVIGCVGAALAIAAQRRLWRSALLAA